MVANPLPVRLSEARGGGRWGTRGDIKAREVPSGDVAMVGEEASACLKLFIVFGTLLLVDLWILADLKSSRNLIAKEAFNKFPFKPPMIDCSDVHVVGDSGDELTVLRWTVVSISINFLQFWHEFCVVPELPL